MDRLQREKQNLDQQVLSKDKSEGLEKQNDSDKRLLEARLKVSVLLGLAKMLHSKMVQSTAKHLLTGPVPKMFCRDLCSWLGVSTVML